MKNTNSKNLVIESSFFFHWDTVVWIITIMLLAFCLCFPVYLIMKYGWDMSNMYVIALILLIIIGILLFVPLKLIVDTRQIKLIRAIPNLIIPLSEIAEVELITDPKFTSNMIRTCGCGGFMGYFGSFRHDRLGSLKMYVTHRQQMFIIRLKNGKYYIFSSHIREQIVRLIKDNISPLE